MQSFITCEIVHNLLVHLAVIVIHPKLETEVEVGSEVLLTCVSSGQPLPSISWYKAGTALIENTTISVYEEHVTVAGIGFMRSVLQTCGSDISSFSCVADNNVLAPNNYTLQLMLNLEGKIYYQM